jgi:hypothetical protein
MRQAIILFFVAVSLFIMTVKVYADGKGSELPLTTKAILTVDQGNGTSVTNDDSIVLIEDDRNKEEIEIVIQDSETDEIAFDEPELPWIY